MPRNDLKIGLALSGGGTRCMAHLGMMQVLHERGVRFSRVAGTSGGALIGALFAKGYKPLEILEILESISFLKIVRPAFNWQGLLNLEIAGKEIAKYLQEDDFSTLKIPLTIVATNFSKGKVKYFKKGQLIKPLMASCAIPVIFDPVKINNTYYVDGGIMDNLPIEPLKKKVDVIVGMHCNPIGQFNTTNSWKKAMDRTMLMAISSRDIMKRKKCTLFWEPPKLVNYNVFDLKKLREIYQVGYKYAIKEIKAIDLSALQSETHVRV